MTNSDSDVQLTDEEYKIVADSFDKIRSVLKKRNVNIENVIALVTTDEVQKTTDQVKIKFADKNNSYLKMIAFD